MSRSLCIALAILCAAVPMGAQSNPASPLATQTPAPPQAAATADKPPPASPAQASTAAQPANAAQPAIPTQSDAFCTGDSRTEVKHFCLNLTRLLFFVSGDTKVGKSSDQIASDASLYLDYLDPATEKPREEVVQAVAEVMSVNAASAALQAESQNILQSANQMTTSQQLGAVSSAAGTTSLVSKAGSAAITNLAVDSGSADPVGQRFDGHADRQRGRAVQPRDRHSGIQPGRQPERVREVRSQSARADCLILTESDQHEQRARQRTGEWYHAD